MRLNHTLFGILIGGILGFIVFAFGVDWMIDQIEERTGMIVLIAVVILILIVVIFLSYERWLERLFSSNTTKLSDILHELINLLDDSKFIKDLEYYKKVSKALRNGVTVFAAWSLRLMIFRAILAVALALGGVFASYILVQQNRLIAEQSALIAEQTVASNSQAAAADTQTKMLREQITISETQNELMALNLVTTLRERLIGSAQFDSADPEFEIELEPIEVSEQCVVAISDKGNALYSPANRLEISAIISLAKSQRVGPRVVDALRHLLRDENPSVSFSSLVILDEVNALHFPEFVEISNIRASKLVLDSNISISIRNSIIRDFSCPNCTLHIEGSSVGLENFRADPSIFSSVVWHYGEWGMVSDIAGRSEKFKGANVSESILRDHPNVVGAVKMLNWTELGELLTTEYTAERFELKERGVDMDPQFDHPDQVRTWSMVKNELLETSLSGNPNGDQVVEACDALEKLSYENPFVHFSDS